MDRQTRDEHEQKLAELRRQLEMLESGQLGSSDGKIMGSGTAQSVTRVKKDIAELEALLAEYPN